MIIGESLKLYRRKNGIWYARLPHEKRLSLKTRDREQAERLFKKLARKILQGNVVELEKQSGITLKAFAKEYATHCKAHKKPSTALRDKYSVDKLIEHIGGNTLLRHVTAKRIDDFHTALIASGLKKSGVAITARHCSAAFGQAVKWEYLKSNPYAKAKAIRPDKKPPRFYDQAEIEAIFKKISADQDWSDLITCYLFTGARRIELWALTRRDVDIEHKLITFRISKNQWRTVPIDEPVLSILERRCKAVRVGRLWRTWAHPNAITHRWIRLMKSLKMQGRLHDLRHSFASHMAMGGTAIQRIQQLLGHTDINTTMIYAHLLPEHMREDVARLGKQLKISTTPELKIVSD